MYLVDIGSRRYGFLYRCGGCGRRFKNIEVVNCSDKGKPHMSPLPWGLFESNQTLPANAPAGSQAASRDAKKK